MILFPLMRPERNDHPLPAGKGDHFFSGRSSGNRITSRIVCVFVSSMHQPVDADAQAAGRGHAVLQGADEVVVHLGHRVFLRQAGELLRKSLLLHDRVVQLGVGVGQLHAVDEQLEALGDGRVARLPLGQRAERGRVVVDEHRARPAGPRPAPRTARCTITSGCLPAVGDARRLGRLGARRVVVASVDADVLARTGRRTSAAARAA